MGDDAFPPLRVRESDSDPNVIPVFAMTFSNTVITRLGPGEIQINPVGSSGGAGATEPYVTFAAVGGLTNERVLTAGSSVTIVTDGAAIYINALTSPLTDSGGSFLTYSSSTILPNERVLTAGTALVAATDGTNFFISLATPVAVSSGGTSATSFTNRGVLIGSGTSAIEALAALAQGQLIVGSDAVLAPRILTIGSQGQILSVDTGFGVGLAWVNTTATIAGAGTGSFYVTFAADPALSVEKTLTAGSSVTVVTDAAAIYVNALTGGLAYQATTISTLFPLAGGGDLSANRTHSADTAFLVTSGRTITTLFPMSGGGNLGADRTFAIDTAFLVNSGRTITAGEGLTGGGDLSANRTISLSTPVVVASGGTGATTFANRGVLIGSGTSAIQALLAMSAGSLLVGSGVTFAPTIFGSGGAGTVLITSQGAPNALAWVGTLASVTAFTGLSDVPSSYVGSGGTAVLVNSGGTALRFSPVMVGKVIAMAESSNLLVDASLGKVFTITSSGAKTVNAPTNATSGQNLILAMAASIATLTVSLTTGANAFRFGGDIAVLTVTSTNTTDYIGSIWNQKDSRWDVVAYVRGY